MIYFHGGLHPLSHLWPSSFPSSALLTPSTVLPFHPSHSPYPVSDSAGISQFSGDVATASSHLRGVLQVLSTLSACTARSSSQRNATSASSSSSLNPASSWGAPPPLNPKPREMEDNGGLFAAGSSADAGLAADVAVLSEGVRRAMQVSGALLLVSFPLHHCKADILVASPFCFISFHSVCSICPSWSGRPGTASSPACPPATCRKPIGHSPCVRGRWRGSGSPGLSSLASGVMGRFR